MRMRVEAARRRSTGSVEVETTAAVALMARVRKEWKRTESTEARNWRMVSSAAATAGDEAKARRSGMERPSDWARARVEADPSSGSRRRASRVRASAGVRVGQTVGTRVLYGI